MLAVLLIYLTLLRTGGASGQPGSELSISQPSIEMTVLFEDGIHSAEGVQRGAEEHAEFVCELRSYIKLGDQGSTLSTQNTGKQNDNEISRQTTWRNIGTQRMPHIRHRKMKEAVISPTDPRTRQKRTTRACPPGCSSCSAVNGCVTCDRRYFMFLYRRRMRQTGMCATSCPPGYYGVRYRQYSKCNKCQIAACETCLSRHFCTRCYKPHVQHRGGCVLSCPPGSALDERREVCLESVDCQVGAWSVWSTCRPRGRVCARRGVKTRTRPLVQTPTLGNVVCPDLMERRRCKIPCKDGCRHRKRGKRKRGRSRKRKKHRRRGRGKNRKSLKRRCRNGSRQRCRRARRC